MGSKKRYEKLCSLFKKVEYYPKDYYPHNGFIINDKFIIGKLQNKWRVAGKNKWYYFRVEEDLLKYIKNE